MLKNNKKGHAFVEASLIIPLIILIVVLSLGYAYRACNEVRCQAEKHNLQREDSVIEGHISRNESEYIRRIDILSEGI